MNQKPGVQPAPEPQSDKIKEDIHNQATKEKHLVNVIRKQRLAGGKVRKNQFHKQLLLQQMDRGMGIRDDGDYLWFFNIDYNVFDLFFK